MSQYIHQSIWRQKLAERRRGILSKSIIYWKRGLGIYFKTKEAWNNSLTFVFHAFLFINYFIFFSWFYILISYIYWCNIQYNVKQILFILYSNNLKKKEIPPISNLMQHALALQNEIKQMINTITSSGRLRTWPSGPVMPNSRILFCSWNYLHQDNYSKIQQTKSRWLMHAAKEEGESYVTSAMISPFSACTWAMAPRSRITLNTSYICTENKKYNLNFFLYWCTWIHYGYQNNHFLHLCSNCENTQSTSYCNHCWLYSIYCW